MNTQNELQALHKEIDDLRNENIALHNELVKQNKILFEQIISVGKELAKQQNDLQQAIRFFNSQTLQNHLIRLAGMQTAEFIAQNMNTTKIFNDKKDYLKYVLNHSQSISGGGHLSGVRRLQRRNCQPNRGGSSRQNCLRLRQLRRFAGNLAI